MSDYRQESHIPDASSRPAGVVHIKLAGPSVADDPQLVNTVTNDYDERQSTQCAFEGALSWKRGLHVGSRRERAGEV